MPPDIRINALKNFSGQNYATEEWTKNYLGNFLNYNSNVNTMELDIGVSGKDNLAGGIPLEIFAYNPNNLAIQVLPTSTIAQRDRWTEIYYLNGKNYTKLSGSLLPALRKGAFVFYGSNTATNLAKGKYVTDIGEVITLIADAKNAKAQLNVRAVNADGTYATSNTATISYAAMNKTLYVKESENSDTYVDITMADGFLRSHNCEYTDENETFCIDLFTPGKKIYIHPNDADFTGLIHQSYDIVNVTQVNATAYEYFFILTLDKAIVTDESIFSLDELGTLQNTMLAAVASLNGKNAPTVIGDYNASVGFDSFTGGNSNHNLAHYSFVYGIDNTNAGELSVVLGTNNVNYSAKSLIVGGSNVAGGDGNYVFGTGNSTHGFYSMVIGCRNTADGISQLAIGHSNILHAQNCISIGQNNTVSSKARNSVIIGCSLTNESEGAIAIGASVNKSPDNRYGVFLPGLSVKSHKKELNPLYNPANDTGNTGIDSNGNEQYVLAEEKAYSITYRGHWLAETQILNDNGSITLDHDLYSRWQINSTGNVVLALANWIDGDIGELVIDTRIQNVTIPADWVVPEGFDIITNPNLYVLELCCIGGTIHCHILCPFGSTIKATDVSSDISTAIATHNLLNSAHSTLFETKANVSHSHSISNITSLRTTLDGKANSSHTHSISNITSLQTKLDGKANSSHTHSIDDITLLQDKLDDKSDTTHTHPFQSHEHEISDVNGLKKALNDKADAGSVPSDADISSAIDGHDSSETAHDDIRQALIDKAASIHEHTISEVDGLQEALNSTASPSHTHEISEVNGLRIELNNKADANHVHYIHYHGNENDEVIGLEDIIENLENSIATHANDSNAHNDAISEAIANDHAGRVWTSGWLRNVVTSTSRVCLHHNLNTPLENLEVKIFLRWNQAENAGDYPYGTVFEWSYKTDISEGAIARGILVHSPVDSAPGDVTYISTSEDPTPPQLYRRPLYSYFYEY